MAGSSPKMLAQQSVAAVGEQIEDETTPLFAEHGTRNYQSLPHAENAEQSSGSETSGDVVDKKDAEPIFGILSVLLIGVFVSQADTSLVLATYGEIASQFGHLESASWLLSTYMLAMCVGQPLYGKLSDIFGRKAMLQIAYGLFAIGSGLCGASHGMSLMIIARAVQGVGGAGMVCLVSILITDLVPLRDVAMYRSYVNIVQTVGRSCGGAIGGWLAQTVGWRWAFLGQVPLTFLAMLLVAWKLNVVNKHEQGHDTAERHSMWNRLARIDFLGAALMSISILSMLTILETGGSNIPWLSMQSFALLGAGIGCGVLFVVAEKRWANEPIFPLDLLSHYDVVTSYIILAFQNASQTALMLYIPLYFEVTRNASTAEAGAYLIPAIVGNTIGGLLTGAYIKRTGYYKPPTILSSLSAGICFLLLTLFWNGQTPPWQSSFVFFGGLATGIAHSSVFVAVSAGVGEKKMAIAGSGLYLSGNVGAVTGVAASSALFQASLRHYLVQRLEDVPNGKEIAGDALSDIHFVQKLTGRTRHLVVGSYTSSFQNTFIMCLAFAGVCLVVSAIMRQKRL